MYGNRNTRARSYVEAALTAVLALLSPACGPGGTTDSGMVPDTDSGVMPPTDGGNGHDVVVPPTDGGPDVQDSGGDRDGASGAVCMPSEADVMCTMGSYSSCRCDNTYIMDTCARYPDMCMGERVNVCGVGMNHCGLNLPTDMPNYEPFRHLAACLENLRNDRWSFGGTVSIVDARYINGQFSIRGVDGGSICDWWTCSGEYCWCNGSNMTRPFPGSAYSLGRVRFTSTMPCTGMVVEWYAPGRDPRRGDPPDRRVNAIWVSDAM